MGRHRAHDRHLDMRIYVASAVATSCSWGPDPWRQGIRGGKIRGRYSLSLVDRARTVTTPADDTAIPAPEAEIAPEAPADSETVILGDGTGLPPVEIAPWLPTGYELRGGWIWRVSVDARTGQPKRVLVARGPIRVMERTYDADDGSSRLVLTWGETNGAAAGHEIGRDVCLTARRVSEIASIKAPVSSEEAREIVRYLAFADSRIRTQPATTRRCGWHGDAYLRGTHAHGDAPAWRSGDPGADQIVAAIGEHGDLAEWSALV